MATDRDAPTRQTAFEDLVARLQQLRGGDHAADVARHLFAHASDGRELVALAAADRAVFYDPAGRSLAAVPFDAHGVDATGSEQVWGPLADPATWVDASEDLPWVHPRYRWVEDADRSAWRY